MRTSTVTIMGTIMGTAMPTEPAPRLARLFQLISPSLPIGAYSYSQGIEWAAEAGWIRNADDLHDWLDGLMRGSQQYLELPVLLRLLDAWRRDDPVAVRRWNAFLIASRESRELRLEERQRARSMQRILESLDDELLTAEADLYTTQHAVFSRACVAWGIDDQLACQGLLWSWLENLVLAAVKILPLGQTEGQRVLMRLADNIPALIAVARELDDDELGASSQALALASSAHEAQYTRLFRS